MPPAAAAVDNSSVLHSSSTMMAAAVGPGSMADMLAAQRPLRPAAAAVQQLKDLACKVQEGLQQQLLQQQDQEQQLHYHHQQRIPAARTAVQQTSGRKVGGRSADAGAGL